MSNRTAGIIDAEIDAIKVNNPNWLADIGDKALITALTNAQMALRFSRTFYLRNLQQNGRRKNLHRERLNWG